jgi:hypothetical protein
MSVSRKIVNIDGDNSGVFSMSVHEKNSYLRYIIGFRIPGIALLPDLKLCKAADQCDPTGKE